METNNAGLNLELKVFLLISLLNCTTFIRLEHSRTRNLSQGGFYYVNLINMYIFSLIFPVESIFFVIVDIMSLSSSKRRKTLHIPLQK